MKPEVKICTVCKNKYASDSRENVCVETCLLQEIYIAQVKVCQTTKRRPELNQQREERELRNLWKELRKIQRKNEQDLLREQKIMQDQIERERLLHYRSPPVLRPKPNNQDIYDIDFNSEHEFQLWFNQSYFMFGFRRLLKSDPFFPDVIAETIDGETLRIELEFHSSNFASHKHNPALCDMVISFIKPFHKTHILGLPIIAIFEATRDASDTGNYNRESRQITPFFRNLLERQKNNLMCIFYE